MGRWGTDSDEDFIIGVAGLTTDFVDNTKIANIGQCSTFVLLIDYSKGTEDTINIEISFTHQFLDSGSKVFYGDSVMDINSKIARNFLYTLNASATDPGVHISIPIVSQYDQVRVRVAGTGTPSGTLSLDFVTDEFVARS